jgi:uncharacterized protein
VAPCSETARGAWYGRSFGGARPGRASISWSSRGPSCLIPSLPALKPITAPLSAARCGDACTTGPERVAVRALLLALRAYKLCVSPFFAGSCRFLPSCADYMAEAVERHGAWRGAVLGLARLARCHPLCRPGFDPVPAATTPGKFRMLPDKSGCPIEEAHR